MKIHDSESTKKLVKKQNFTSLPIDIRIHNETRNIKGELFITLDDLETILQNEFTKTIAQEFCLILKKKFGKEIVKSQLIEHCQQQNKPYIACNLEIFNNLYFKPALFLTSGVIFLLLYIYGPNEQKNTFLSISSFSLIGYGSIMFSIIYSSRKKIIKNNFLELFKQPMEIYQLIFIVRWFFTFLKTEAQPNNKISDYLAIGDGITGIVAIINKFIKTIRLNPNILSIINLLKQQNSKNFTPNEIKNQIISEGFSVEQATNSCNVIFQQFDDNFNGYIDQNELFITKCRKTIKFLFSPAFWALLGFCQGYFLLFFISIGVISDIYKDLYFNSVIIVLCIANMCFVCMFLQAHIINQKCCKLLSLEIIHQYECNKNKKIDASIRQQNRKENLKCDDDEQ